jgi:hypothetical protein
MLQHVGLTLAGGLHAMANQIQRVSTPPGRTQDGMNVTTHTDTAIKKSPRIVCNQQPA